MILAVFLTSLYFFVNLSFLLLLAIMGKWAKSSESRGGFKILYVYGLINLVWSIAMLLVYIRR